MGRYRPPSAPKSPYITREGYEALAQEQSDLWKKRKEVVKALSAAAAEGDRSENAEYIYRKKQLREMDRRIRYLQKRLPDLTEWYFERLRDTPDGDGSLLDHSTYLLGSGMGNPDVHDHSNLPSEIEPGQRLAL